jgi:hypothetical protein
MLSFTFAPADGTSTAMMRTRPIATWSSTLSVSTTPGALSPPIKAAGRSRSSLCRCGRVPSSCRPAPSPAPTGSCQGRYLSAWAGSGSRRRLLRPRLPSLEMAPREHSMPWRWPRWAARRIGGGLHLAGRAHPADGTARPGLRPTAAGGGGDCRTASHRRASRFSVMRPATAGRPHTQAGGGGATDRQLVARSGGGMARRSLARKGPGTPSLDRASAGHRRSRSW